MYSSLGFCVGKWSSSSASINLLKPRGTYQILTCFWDQKLTLLSDVGPFSIEIILLVFPDSNAEDVLELWVFNCGKDYFSYFYICFLSSSSNMYE